MTIPDSAIANKEASVIVTFSLSSGPSNSPLETSTTTILSPISVKLEYLLSFSSS